MNILIEPEALGGKDPSLLWPGALYGLKRLQELGHTLYLDPDSLSDDQHRLLDNEGIDLPGGELPETPDLRITTADGMLGLSDKGNILATEDDWAGLSDRICFPERTASLSRKTAETDITISLSLDGTGRAEINTGLKFFDHMLEQIAKHGLLDLRISCTGDLEVDEHHTIEDVAITLGDCLSEALGNKVGIQRHAFALPMDESRARVALDLSGRPYLVFEGGFDREKVGDFPTEMTEHFFYSLAMHLKATLHLKVEGRNDHHKIEACFKAFARCLRAAVSRSERNLNILPSTKDLL